MGEVARVSSTIDEDRWDERDAPRADDESLALEERSVRRFFESFAFYGPAPDASSTRAKDFLDWL